MKRTVIFLMAVMVILSSGTMVQADNVVNAPGTGTSEVQVEVEATTFSVTVPLNLAIHVSSAGVVTPATEAKIINNSYGAVKVTDVAITAEPGWTIVDFDTDMTKEKVGAKKLGFKLNGGVTTGAALGKGTFDIMYGNGGQAPLTYDAVVPAQETPIVSGTKVASIVFTVAWNE